MLSVDNNRTRHSQPYSTALKGVRGVLVSLIICISPTKEEWDNVHMSWPLRTDPMAVSNDPPGNGAKIPGCLQECALHRG